MLNDCGMGAWYRYAQWPDVVAGLNSTVILPSNVMLKQSGLREAVRSVGKNHEDMKLPANGPDPRVKRDAARIKTLPIQRSGREWRRWIIIALAANNEEYGSWSCHVKNLNEAAVGHRSF
jgi:hypothetical protein